MMKKWIRLGRTQVFGARLYIHWSVVAVVALLAFMSFKSPVHAAVAIISYLGIIVIHELGHAFMARRLGYDVDSIRVAFLHGLCECDAPHRESNHVLIAWGGVMAQLLIAVPILIVATVFDERDFGYAAPAIAFLGYVNLLIALVNLAPSPGLDGYIAWRAIPLLRQRWGASRTKKRPVRHLTRVK